MKRFLLPLLAGLLCLPCRSVSAEASATNDPGRLLGRVTPLAATAGIARGEFHLLAIGIDRYLHVTPLATAANGVRALAGVLTNDYGFTHVTVLLDAQATRPNILRELRRVLLGNAGTNDSVLIYYAGHGQIDEQTQAGSWIPVEGLAPDPDNPASEAPSTWLSNSDIKTLIRASKARHILLVSDSCFSGDFLRTPRAVAPGDTPEALRSAHARPSRQALAAGGLEPVADQGGGDGQSAFTGPLLRLLREQDGAFVLPYQLHGRVADALVMNARQRPQLGRLFDAGDEVGGEFIFFRHRLSLDEALADRERQKVQLAALAAAADQAEQERQTKIAAQQAELAKQDSEIAALRAKLKQSGAGGGSLAQMVALLKQREAAAAELKRLEEEAAAARVQREQELARLRTEELVQAKARFDRLYADYQLIRKSPLMQDAEKSDAWLALCTELGVTPQGSRPGMLVFRESDGQIVEVGVGPGGAKKAEPAGETPAVVTVAKVAAPTAIPAEAPPATTSGAASVQWTKDNPFVNSLGMKFVPVPGTDVLFSVWETRKQDFQAFVVATGYEPAQGMLSYRNEDLWKQRGDTWENPGFPQTLDHPVVGVSWDAAQKFAAWLTERERGAGRLTARQSYRLPTDEEWSTAVGLTKENGNTPKERSSMGEEVYPWGTVWPPPRGAGNFGDVTAKAKFGKLTTVDGYDDGYANTAPVGAFAADQHGLFDMGGNVREWCEDWYDGEQKTRTVRGPSYIDGFQRALRASNRIDRPADSCRDYIGFRLVLGGVLRTPTEPLPHPGSVQGRPISDNDSPAMASPAKIGTWSKDNPFVNSLGMRFVPVSGTEVLFSVWETRKQDYEAFANAVSGVDDTWQKPGFPQAPTHPVVNVSWEDARKFAAWLTEKERRGGRLTAQQSYRLPTDVEWSRAVGLTSEPGSTPKARDGAVKDAFPWGTQWPPPQGVGNYDSYSAIGPAIGPAPLQRRDRLAQGVGIGGAFESSKARTDSFDRTCPVGGFPANQFGLFDLGGNALEWCDDPYEGNSGARVLRGGSWSNLARGLLLSSDRSSGDPDSRRNYYGFRVVLAGTGGR